MDLDQLPMPASRKKHHVFLSFRGEDTRDTFISHLHKELVREKIETYFDERLVRGDDISQSLLDAIEDSKISVIIFSENYASSSWCLDELVHILHCREKNKHIVLPVFYHVNPSDVRRQRGSYEAAFVKLEERYEDKIIDKWRAALTTVANLYGCDASKSRNDSELVESIVKDIMGKLNSTSSSDIYFKGLVGIDKLIEDLNPLLFSSSSHARIVGIWGMGGLGKTTLAHAVFRRFHSQFEGHCFLANVREEWKKGSVYLQQKFFAQLFKEKDVYMGNMQYFAKEKFGCKKLLIVLDDVDDAEQYQHLVEDPDWLSSESRVILTSRNKLVLLNVGVDGIYNLKSLHEKEALQLFCLHAFKRNFATEGFLEISREFLYYAGGVPLALKVLGSHLYSKSKKEWKSTLNKLKVIPNMKIHNILKISYDGLDDKEKETFLDIACFCKYMDKDYVKEILDDRGYFAVIIKDLEDKSLITISANELWMHNLLQEMCWEIVRGQYRKKLEEQSRLWIMDDICDVLRNNLGTARIEGIQLTGAIREDIDLEPNAFQKMRNLRLLKIATSKGQFQFHLPRGLHSFPDSIRYIHWDNYPSKSLGSLFRPCNLVKLDMRFSQLEKLWNGSKHDLQNLKFVDLCYSEKLTSLPHLSSANLKRLDLRGCTSLVELPPLRFETEETEEESINNCWLAFNHQDLNDNNNSPRKDWWNDDDEINRNLLDLRGCSYLKTLSDISGNIKYISLRSTAIEELHSSLGSLNHLGFLDLKDCKCLKDLPSSICDLESLNYLDMGGCFVIDKFPVLPQNIRNLNLSGTSIEQIEESSFECLPNLKTLVMNNCSRLKTLPKNISKLKSLLMLSLSGCSKLNSFPDILEPMEYLYGLFLDETGIKELPSSIGNLNGLAVLNLRQCKYLESIPTIKPLLYLCLNDCPRLKHFPAIPFGFCQYFSFYLSYSNILKLREWHHDLSSLEILDTSGTTTSRIPIRITRNRRDGEHCNMSFMMEECSHLTYSQESVLLYKKHDDGDQCNIGLTRCMHYWCKFQREFSYYDCLDFEDVRNILMTEFQLNILHKTTASVLKHGIQEVDHPRISFSYPGNKIPQWFTNHTTGSSIDINFSPLWHDTSLGFALCIVVDCECWDYNTDHLDLSCEYHFKTKDGESHQYHWTLQRSDYTCDYDLENMTGIYRPSHVFIWHLYEDDYHDYHEATGASFKFYPDGQSNVAFGIHRIKECGIRRLTLKDAKEFGIIELVPAQNTNSDSNQPHPRRIKISN